MVLLKTYIALIFVAVNLILNFSSAFSETADSLKQEISTVHAQTTVIGQYKPPFAAKYSGINSLSSNQEYQNSITSTLFLGARLWKNSALFFNPELGGGSGLSAATGAGDALNGETYRVGSPKPEIIVARFFFRQLIPLDNDTPVYSVSGNNCLAGYYPKSYIALTVGKVSVSDYFDLNCYSHDPRTQFITWSLMNAGAWDYPANTRGYTPSILLEYISPRHELRYAFSMVPKTVNGMEMDGNLSKAHSQTLEYAYKYNLSNNHGAFRLLGFYTNAFMGNYNRALSINPVNPDISTTRTYTSFKYGFGINCEQAISDNSGFFLRANWNNGATETWMFTEIDHSLSLGFSVTGSNWNRPGDNAGIAYVVSGLSKEHINYLKAGGAGFMLGDGNIRYAPEHLTEMYYSFEAIKNSLNLSASYQLLFNPGFNRDRMGPVSVFSIRTHIGI